MNLQRNENDENQKRWFPLEGYFFDYKIDDIVYGYIVYRATYDEITKKLYITPNKYDRAIEELASALIVEKRIIKAHLQKIFEAGLIQYDEKNCRYLIKNYGDQEKYTIIMSSLLFFLVSGLNRHSLKIAAFLLNKYLYYTIKYGKFYNFTLLELSTMMGYSPSSKSRTNKMLKKVLKWLCLAGVINLKEGYYAKHPCYFLTYGATREDNLKPQPLDELKFLED